MAFENNIPKIKNNFGVDGMRDISARRAATISNMIEEAAKQGIDDSFARTAIGRYGADNAKAMREGMKNPDDFAVLIAAATLRRIFPDGTFFSPFFQILFHKTGRLKFRVLVFIGYDIKTVHIFYRSSVLCASSTTAVTSTGNSV